MPDQKKDDSNEAALAAQVDKMIAEGFADDDITFVINEYRKANTPQAKARKQADTDAPAYLGEMLGNIKDDAWNQGVGFFKGLRQLPAMVSGATTEARNKMSDKLLDTVGLDAYMSDKPRNDWFGRPVPLPPPGTPNLDALKAGASATVQHYADYLDPEKRALQVRDRPVETVLDLIPVGGFLAKTPAMVRSGGAAVNRAANAARATAAAHPIATEAAISAVPGLGRARQTLKTVAASDRQTQAIKDAAASAERIAAEKLAQDTAREQARVAAKATKDAEKAATKAAADAAATEAARVKELKRVADEASLTDPRLAPEIESQLGPKVEDILKKEPVGPVDEGPLRAVMDEHMANREAQGPRAERRSSDLITEGLEDYPARPDAQFPREDVPGLVRDELSSMEGAADWALGDVARSPSPRPVTTPATRLPPGKPLTQENIPGFAQMSPDDQAYWVQVIENQQARDLAVKNAGKTPAVVVPKAAAPAAEAAPAAAAAAAEPAVVPRTTTGTAWAPGEIPTPAPRPVPTPEAPVPRPDVTPEPAPPVREAGPATDLGANPVTPEPAGPAVVVPAEEPGAVMRRGNLSSQRRTDRGMEDLSANARKDYIEIARANADWDDPQIMKVVKERSDARAAVNYKAAQDRKAAREAAAGTTPAPAAGEPLNINAALEQSLEGRTPAPAAPAFGAPVTGEDITRAGGELRVGSGSGRSAKTPAMVKSDFKVKKAADFNTTGSRTLTFNDGREFKIYHDPERRMWYAEGLEDAVPGRGITRDDLIERLRTLDESKPHVDVYSGYASGETIGERLRGKPKK